MRRAEHVREPGARAPFSTELVAAVASAVASWWDSVRSRRLGFPSLEEIGAANRWWLRLVPFIREGHESCTCWACGYHGDGLQKAHIRMRARGGSNAPRNFMILCYPCHRRGQPEEAPPDVQFAWLAGGWSTAWFRTPLWWSEETAKTLAVPLYLEDVRP